MRNAQANIQDMAPKAESSGTTRAIYQQLPAVNRGNGFNNFTHRRCAHRFYLPVDDQSNYMTGFRRVEDVE